MADVTPDAVRQSLKQCMDPEVPINIIDMGLIYGIDVSGSDVNVRMTMTTQGCPLHEINGTVMVKRHAKKVYIRSQQTSIPYIGILMDNGQTL